MSLKTIKVNPIFLASMNAKNKTRKEKPVGVSLGQSNNIKKKLIARIKNFQQNTKPEKNVAIANGNNINDAFKTEFSNSMQFLDDLAKDKQHNKNNNKNSWHNGTLKKKHIPDPNAHMQIATELPPELSLNWTKPLIGQVVADLMPPVPASLAAPAPVPVPVPAPAPILPAAQPLYSNMKNGSRPTYRTWLRTTQKNKPVINKPPINILEDIATNADITTDAFEESRIIEAPQIEAPQIAAPQIEAPQIAAPQIAINQLVEEPPIPDYKPSLPKRKRITRTFKYKLGKHANGKVSVLIKNAQTRRKIQTEQAQLKRKSILEIKNHLRSKNLLKVGSNAPNDVLRELYEQSILAGQIENKAKETLIHNYFNGTNEIGTNSIA
jgi:hypothetical protein